MLQDYGTKQVKNSWCRSNFTKRALYPCALSFWKNNSKNHSCHHGLHCNKLLPCDLSRIYNWSNIIYYISKSTVSVIEHNHQPLSVARSEKYQENKNIKCVELCIKIDLYLKLQSRQSRNWLGLCIVRILSKPKEFELFQ